VILAGGGTGGHIYPAVAIASEFKSRYPDSEILFVGTKKGLEKEIVSKHQFRLEFISAKGFVRGLKKEILLLPFFLMRSIIETWMIMRNFKPDIVVGTGGYVSLPVVLMAGIMGKKTLIQEQNSFPGLSTRILSLVAGRVCLSYENSANFFLVRKKLKILGNPVRKGIISGEKNKGIKELNLHPDKKTLFILGGSQGSKKINASVKEAVNYFEQYEDIQLLWQTGEKDFENIKNFMKDKKITSSVFPFIQDMASAYAVSDLLVCRAGALTLSEIAACGKPSILIPYPFATGDHQRYNALFLKEKGAAELLLESELMGENLAERAVDLLMNENKLKQMSENIKTLAKPLATSQIVNEMEELLER